MSDIKQNWEVVEHSWSDTSIMCGDKTICTMSIYDEATEETQDELEDEVSRNFKLIASAPELLEACKEALKELQFHNWQNTTTGFLLEAVIKKATSL